MRLNPAPADVARWRKEERRRLRALRDAVPAACRVAVLRLREKGSKAALPVVVAKAQPLEFREWWPGIAILPGVFGLPIPQGVPPIRPEAVLMPPVGFDASGYRLGYGGGYFDRTLASLSPQPLKIGVGHELSRVETIHPQPHDIPMDFVVTEHGVHTVDAGGLRAVEAAEAAARASAIRSARTRGARARCTP